MSFKNIFFLYFLMVFITTNLFAQNKNDFAENWKKVEGLEKKGLTKTALNQIMIIYDLAKKNNNEVQQIKSAIYQIKYRSMVQEDSRENNIFFVDTLIAKSGAPVKNILQNMQAEMFWQYLQRNRYKFYNRTKLAVEKSKDISTWSLEKLNETISTLYNQSLANEKLLQATKIEGFDPIIIKGVNTRQLRPTLYDFLAFRALDYFKNDERYLTNPAYKFTINDQVAFAPAAEFAKASFLTRDTASLQYKAILLLQNILSFHLKDKDPNALVDADLIRLNYVQQHAVNEDKSERYEAALKSLETTYPNEPASAQAIFLRAQIYYNRGLNYITTTTTGLQYEIKRAEELAAIAVKKFPAAEGGINAQNLISQILQPALSLLTEKINVPAQAFRTLVTYKNTRTIYLRIIKTSREEINSINARDKDKFWKNIVAQKAIKNWQVTLPDPQDFQSHSAEIKIDALESGVYYILSSLDEKFSLEKNIIAKQVTYVSNISLIHNNKKDYYVLNRENGEPLNNAKIQVWQIQYNNINNKREDIKAEQYTSDKNGLFKLKASEQFRSINFQINTGKEELFTDNNNYNNEGFYNDFDRTESIAPLSFMFTDRSIYRPGQTIYFKGIVIKKLSKGGEKGIYTSFKTTVQLRDANNQKLNELRMVTNEYGSYHGAFKLSETGLNGTYSLYDSSTATTQYINVEAYKRPKFYVTIEKPKGTYRLMDSIKITGTAKAYAGNIIDGAKVSYRVVRKVRYPIWWSWGGYNSFGNSIYPPGNTNEVEIANGTTSTDAKGEFTTSFKALPDESIDKKTQPIFYYEVSADITDINGETRSSNTSVAVAYQMLQLDIKLPAKLLIDSLKNITIKSTNLNDIEENVIATVSIQQLKSPGKIFRERFWSVPDQFVMSKEEYYSNFPYDVYKDENEIKNYEKGEKIIERIDSTNKILSLGVQPLKAGWYLVTAITKDKYGEEVRAEKYFELYNNKKSEVTDKPIECVADKNMAEPGEKIKYTITTGFNKIWLIQSLSKMSDSTRTNYQSITTNKPSQNELTIKETDRGGIEVDYVFVQHNRMYKGEERFDIPWSNKELNINYSSFRDKLLPGSTEKWKAKISGTKGEKLATEILVSMYDASLDQFKTHGWSALNIWPNLDNTISWIANGFEVINSEESNWGNNKYISLPAKTYDQLLNTNATSLDEVVVIGYSSTKRKDISGNDGLLDIARSPVVNQSVALQDQVAEIQISNTGENKKVILSDSISTVKAASKNTAPEQPSIRKNFNETAFFFSDLKTDTAGNIEFSFTMPEALTQWKLMTFAHTKDLASGYSEKTTVTQKPLMVQANAPRFLREGDGLELSAKIINLSDKEITGTTQLELFDVATNKPIDGWFKNIFSTQYFTVAAGQSVAVKFPMEIPFNFNSALTYRITASSSNKTAGANFSDGEELSIPILTNRMLVTESLPLNLRNETTKSFSFDKLLKSGNSQTLTNHALTVEFTTNPAWYAVQALPYLMEYPYECAEQTFNRYYANTLAESISNSMPKIKAVFEKWLTLDTTALLSNLQKNEELKAALLQETPWVLDAQNESKQKKNIALLFDMVKMNGETDKAITKLKDMQSNSGGFVWFKGGQDDRYITQYILTGIGHLKKLQALSANNSGQLKDIMSIVNKAIPYLDTKIKEEYEALLKYKTILKNNNLSNTAIQYLYMRSFFTEIPVTPSAQTAYTYYKGQSKKYWLGTSKYLQAMIALSLNRTKDEITPTAIIKSLKENAIINEDLGMYWKEFTNGGYYWYQAPIESQSLMIEAFTDIDKNTVTINDLKTWLLKQKQTQNWKTTKATADACYALLLNETNYLAVEKKVNIQIGNTIIKSSDEKTEAGTGYFKKTFKALDINPEMGNIKVTTTIKNASNTVTKDGSTAWGAVYWQYFEDLDKITYASTPLKLTKNLFVEKNTDKGPELIALTDGATLKVGDKVKIRIGLKADRDMEYLHMKDMRAACMEPTNVLSQYKYQDGLGYYQSTLDASTNFFFGRLPRGSYIFEYELFVTTPGNFSNGITSIQCMYAPEFTSHSEGIRVTVEGK